MCRGVLFLALLFAQPSNASPSFQGLGDLGGTSFSSYAFAISADGTTVAGQAASPNGNEAFVWTASTGMQGLGDIEGGRFDSHALGLSADGTVAVGGVSTLNGQEAFRWTSSTGMESLGELTPGHTAGCAFGVSANGATIGGYGPRIDGQFSDELSLWTESTGIVGIGWPSGFTATDPAGLSFDGTALAGTHLGSIEPQAFKWDAANGHQLIDGLSERNDSWAYGISGDGTVVVGHSYNGDTTEAFRWSAAEGTQGLGFLLDDAPAGSTANAASADGSVIVGSSSGDLSGGGAFIWDKNHGMRSIQVLLTQAGLNLDGWQLRGATGVSADGRAIVGSGRNPDGFTEAWIAVIPEPGTALFLGLGLAGLASRRRLARSHVGRSDDMCASRIEAIASGCSTFATSALVLLVVSTLAASRASAVLIDDFSDGNDDGWTYN